MSPVRQIDEDEALLKLIVHGAARDDRKGECPSDEKIAAFLDSNLPKQERDALMDHMARCVVCREIMRESRLTGDDVAESMARKRRVLMRFALPLAAAAMVILFISVKSGFWMQIPERKGPELAGKEAGKSPATETKTDVAAPSLIRPYTPPQTSEIADALASGAAGKQAANAAVRIEGSAEYGFAGAINRDRHAFGMGVLLMELDVVIRAEDAEKTEQLIKELKGRVKTLDKDHQAGKLLDRRAEDIVKGMKPSSLAGLSSEISASFGYLPSAPYVSFGVWAEGNRIGIHSGSLQFLTRESIEHFSRLVQGAQLPQQVLASLGRLEQMQKSGSSSRKVLRDAERELQNIIEVMR